MQFFSDGEWHQVARITGPTHNLLGLKLGSLNGATLAVEAMSQDESAGRVNADEVVRQVLDGVKEANAQLGTGYQVIAVRYVPTDTASRDVYRLLTRSLIENVHGGERGKVALGKERDAVRATR